MVMTRHAICFDFSEILLCVELLQDPDDRVSVGRVADDSKSFEFLATRVLGADGGADEGRDEVLEECE